MSIRLKSVCFDSNSLLEKYGAPKEQISSISSTCTTSWTANTYTPANPPVVLDVIASNQFASRKDRADVWSNAWKNRVEELEDLLAKEREANLTKTSVIECLHQNIQRKNLKLISLKKDREENEEKICWLKHRCKMIHKTIHATKNARTQTDKIMKTIKKVVQSTSPQHIVTFGSIGEFHETDEISHAEQSNQLGTIQISRTEPLIELAVESNEINKWRSSVLRLPRETCNVLLVQKNSRNGV